MPSKKRILKRQPRSTEYSASAPTETAPKPFSRGKKIKAFLLGSLGFTFFGLATFCYTYYRNNKADRLQLSVQIKDAVSKYRTLLGIADSLGELSNDWTVWNIKMTQMSVYPHKRDIDAFYVRGASHLKTIATSEELHADSVLTRNFDTLLYLFSWNSELDAAMYAFIKEAVNYEEMASSD